MTNGINGHANGTNGKIDTMNPHDSVHFDPSLQPKSYTIKGTDPNSKVLFRDVNIIDSTGADPFKGDVYIEGGLRPNPRLITGTNVKARRTHQVCRRSS